MPRIEIEKDAGRRRETGFVDKLIYAGIAHNSCRDGFGSLRATVPSSYLKILKILD
jgi:hypothetical protein